MQRSVLTSRNTWGQVLGHVCSAGLRAMCESDCPQVVSRVAAEGQGFEFPKLHLRVRSLRRRRTRPWPGLGGRRLLGEDVRDTELAPVIWFGVLDEPGRLDKSYWVQQRHNVVR